MCKSLFTQAEALPSSGRRQPESIIGCGLDQILVRCAEPKGYNWMFFLVFSISPLNPNLNDEAISLDGSFASLH